MDLKSRNKIEVTFSMASMTDVIFLLLIFFMLSSTFITPSGLPVNLPSSKNPTIVLQKVSVTITEDLEYFVNDKKTSFNSLRKALRRELKGGEGVIVLHIDKSVPVEYLVKVASIAIELKAKVSVATKPLE